MVLSGADNDLEKPCYDSQGYVTRHRLPGAGTFADGVEELGDNCPGPKGKVGDFLVSSCYLSDSQTSHTNVRTWMAGDINGNNLHRNGCISIVNYVKWVNVVRHGIL